MAINTIKVIAQSAPLSATLTDVYTCAVVSTTISTISVVNTAATPASFRLSVAVSGAADNIKQYIYYDLTISGFDTFCATMGVTMSTTDVLRVFASAAQISFNFFGVEVS